MEGGDLTTMPRGRGGTVQGGDLKTMARQHGGFFHLIPKLFGLGASDMQKHMSDPIRSQMLMQRGGFPWALAGLSLLPMLLGKGKEDSIRNQMKTSRDPVMQRGGLSVPPALLAKGLPLLKSIGIPLAMGALASMGDKVVDKVFGDGRVPGATSRRRGGLPSRRRSGLPPRRPPPPGGKTRKGSSSSSSSSGRRGRRRGQRAGKRTPKKRGRRPHSKAMNQKKMKKTRRGSSGKAATRTRRGHTRRPHPPSSSSSVVNSLLKKAQKHARGRARDVGKRFFEKANSRRRRTVSLPSATAADNITPFARKIRENLNRASSAAASAALSSPSSAHIGQSFNI